MRDILTGLAIIVIVVLTTLLVAPYFVDWNGQRGFLETQLTRAFGQTVTIGGSIDLKLLPTPYIRLNQTVIGDDRGAMRIGIRHLDLELAVAPLLYGEFDIVEGRLDEPTIRLTLQPDRTLPAFPETPALKADIRLERIAVRDGTLAVADPASGRTFVVDHLDFTADAPSLAGPFKGSGSAGADAGHTTFRFNTTEAKKGRTHLHLALGETTTHPGLDLDGDVTLDDKPGAGRQGFDGTVTALGHLAAPEGGPLAWRLAGPLKVQPNGARLAGGELRLGGGDGLAFKADVAGSFGEAAAVTATFAAAQLDVDRLAGLSPDPSKPLPPPQLPSVARLRALVEAALPPLPTTLDVTVDNATWGGEALSDLSLHATPGGGAGSLQASGDGPGGLHLSLDGALAAGGTGFTGQARLGADDLPRALTWLATVASDLAPSRGALPFAQAAIAGPVVVDGAGLAATDAALDLDRSHLHGSLRFAFGAGARPPRLAADLQTEALDLDGLPDARLLARGADAVAFDVRLAAGSARIASVGSGALEAGRIALDIAGRGGHVDLRKLGVENLGGATLTATGHLDGGDATLNAHVDADRLEAMAALARQVAPGAWSDAFVARAPSLAPAHLSGEASLAGTASQGKLAYTRLALDGTLAGTKLAVKLAPETDGGTATLAARADAADGLSLLRQLGLPVVATAAPVGAGRLVLSASGKDGASLATRLDAGLGATQLAVDGRFDLLGKADGGSGTATLKSADLGPILRALGLASADAAQPVPIDLSGALAVGQNGLALSDIEGKAAGATVAGTLKLVPPSGDAPVLTGSLDLDRLALGSVVGLALGPGRPPAAGTLWSKEPFASAAADLPRTDLSLRAHALDLADGVSAGDATLDLRLGPGLVAVSHGEGTLAGGRLGGGFTLRRDGGQATVEGTLTADRIALELPALKAGLSGKLDLAGGGGSALSLVNSLAGSGAATLADARLPGAEPSALVHVFAAVEDDTLAVDEEAVTRAFDEASHAPFAAGTRHVTLGLAGGTLTLAPTDDAAAPAGPVSATLGATLNLDAPRLAVSATETLHALPRDWSGPPPAIVVTFAGPPRAPRRSFDVGTFLNAVAARAIARETARVEAFEFDIRERALDAARLQSEHRREADRVKAAADAKAAEAARRAAADLARKAEAARQQKQRADDAAGAQTDAPQPFQAQPPGANADPTAAGRY